MAKARTKKANGPDDGESVEDSGPGLEEGANGRGTDPDQSLSQVLGHLDADARLQVERLSPAYASGWLDDLVVPTGQEGEVLGLIRQNFGGGSFRIRAKTKHSSGRLLFAKGSATVNVAGPPTFYGKHYNRDGSFVEVVPAPPAAPAMQPVAVAAPQNQVELINALAAVLQPQGGAQQGPPLQGVPELISALRTAAVPTPTDPYAQLERAVGLLGKLRRAFPENESGGDSDGSFLGGSDERMLMMLMSQQQQPQQPPWGQQWGYPQQQGWQQQPWQQAPPQQQQQAPPQQQQQAPTAEPLDMDGDPYTVDDVLAGVEGLSDTDKMHLLTRLGEVLPASMAQEIEATLGAQANG